MYPISLIIVDDYEILRKGLKIILQSEQNFKIIGEASSGRDLMELVKKSKPDVIILDDYLPQESGIDICKELTKTYSDLKIIIMTDYPGKKETIVRAMMAGAKGFLVKNVELAELKRSIKVIARGDTVLDSQVAARLIDKIKKGPNKESPSYEFTEQHLNIARLVAQGLTNKKIAENLCLSENTVKFHLKRIMRRLQVSNRVNLVAKLIEENII